MPRNETLSFSNQVVGSQSVTDQKLLRMGLWATWGGGMKRVHGQEGSWEMSWGQITEGRELTSSPRDCGEPLDHFKPQYCLSYSSIQHPLNYIEAGTLSLSCDYSDNAWKSI